MSVTCIAKYVSRAPMIMNHDNIDWREEVEAWILANKKTSKPGDDRTPPWKWMGGLFNDGERVVISSEQMMSALLMAGWKTQRGKGVNISFKDLSQTGLFVADESPLIVGGKEILMKDVLKLRNLSFADQCKGAAKLGIRLYVASVARESGKKIVKNIRVRPRFDAAWSFEVKIVITDTESIGVEDLKTICTNMGRKVGWGDRRPGVKSPKIPGPFGVADLAVFKVVK